MNPGFKRGKPLLQGGDFLLLRPHDFGQHRNDRHGAKAFPVRCHHMAWQLLGHLAEIGLVGHIFFEREGGGVQTLGNLRGLLNGELGDLFLPFP